MEKKRAYKIIIAGVILIFLGTIYQKYFGLEEFLPEKEVKKEDAAPKFKKCPDGWQDYRQDVLGIRFCYPPEWGKPVTEPYEYLTRLPGAVDKYSVSENNKYSNSLFIDFQEPNGQDFNRLELRLFSDKYGGQYYPNAYAQAAGYADNISTLKSGGNICDYRIDFTKPWGRIGTLKEIWQECGNNVKTALIENAQHFDFDDIGMRYSYNLKLFGFRKLRNGYFDNLLISYDLGRISQIAEPVDSLDRFFSAGSENATEKNTTFISQDHYRTEKEKFVRFLESVSVYAPLAETEEEAQKAACNENPDIILIREHYRRLSDGKFEEALPMLAAEIDRARAKEMGENLKKIEPRDIRFRKGGSYIFYLDRQDHNSPPALYRVQARVKNGLIEILSTEEIISDMVSSGDRVAYAKIKNGQSYVVLEQGGKETVVDQGTANYDEKYTNLVSVKNFRDIRFSPDGKYLLYTMLGWEWAESYVYDIARADKVLKVSSPNAFTFTPDGKYFYACASSGMGSQSLGAVYSVPDFKEAYDVLAGRDLGDVMDIRCVYQPAENRIKFDLRKYCSTSSSCQEDLSATYPLGQ